MTDTETTPQDRIATLEKAIATLNRRLVITRWTVALVAIALLVSEVVR